MLITNKEIHHYWLPGHSLRNKDCLPAVSVVETPARLPGWNFVTNLASLSQQCAPAKWRKSWYFSIFCSKLLHCPLGTSPVPCFQSSHLFNKYMSWRQSSQNYQNVTQSLFWMHYYCVWSKVFHIFLKAKNLKSSPCYVWTTVRSSCGIVQITHKFLKGIVHVHVLFWISREDRFKVRFCIVYRVRYLNVPRILHSIINRVQQVCVHDHIQQSR